MKKVRDITLKIAADLIEANNTEKYFLREREGSVESRNKKGVKIKKKIIHKQILKINAIGDYQIVAESEHSWISAVQKSDLVELKQIEIAHAELQESINRYS